MTVINIIIIVTLTVTVVAMLLRCCHTVVTLLSTSCKFSGGRGFLWRVQRSSFFARLLVPHQLQQRATIVVLVLCSPVTLALFCSLSRPLSGSQRMSKCF
jgi:hypothetical protein